MKNTTNYNLIKPSETERYNIELLNQNMDIIDSELGNTSSTVKKTTSAIDSHISNLDQHIQSQERKNWNNAYDHSVSIHARADSTKTEKSKINGNLIIDEVETPVYIHPDGTNPHGTTKDDIGLGNVENKSSYTIREEITKENITNALGYIPSDEKHTHNYAGSSSIGGAAISAMGASDDSDFDFGDISK